MDEVETFEGVELGDGSILVDEEVGWVVDSRFAEMGEGEDVGGSGGVGQLGIESQGLRVIHQTTVPVFRIIPEWGSWCPCDDFRCCSRSLVGNLLGLVAPDRGSYRVGAGHASELGLAAFDDQDVLVIVEITEDGDRRPHAEVPPEWLTSRILPFFSRHLSMGIF